MVSIARQEAARDPLRSHARTRAPTALLVAPYPRCELDEEKDVRGPSAMTAFGGPLWLCQEVARPVSAETRQSRGRRSAPAWCERRAALAACPTCPSCMRFGADTDRNGRLPRRN